MITAQALPLAGMSLANGLEQRVVLLHDLLLKGVAHLERLRDEGVARTNFMKCDERSIYVFEYLFKSPHEIVNADMPPLRRSRNHSLVLEFIDLLKRVELPLAAADLSSVLLACDPVHLSDQEASAGLRICHMVELHTLIFGILQEVLERRLSASLTERQDEILTQAVLPDVCCPGLGYMEKCQFIELLAGHLIFKGHGRAAEIILNQKGRPTW